MRAGTNSYGTTCLRRLKSNRAILPLPKVLSFQGALGFVTYTVALLVLLIAGWFLANRWHRPLRGNIPVQNTGQCGFSGHEISITTWNIGFASLGARADLFIDGGHSLRALSQAEIAAAANCIADTISEFSSDIVLLQEDARGGFMTRGVDVHSKVARHLTDYAQCFWSDFNTLLTPKLFRINHGMAMFSRVNPAISTALTLPQDPLYYYGFLKKYYGGIMQKYTIAEQGTWVVINIHLSAFDDAARQRQLAVLFGYAVDEFNAGNYVVIGGDWNMRLANAEFPSDAKKSDRFEVFDFPQAVLPKGWLLAADSTVPSLRAINAPYVKGETYTSIVDGFVVSPNVRVDAVKTHDLQFEHTDHHPVSARFSMRG